MNSEKHIKYISSLIIKSINKTITDDELKKLNAWRKKSGSNEALYTSLFQKDRLEKDYALYKKMYSGNDWPLLLKRIRRSESSRFVSIFKYAAAIMVIAFITYTVREWNTGKEIITAKTEIFPGTHKAVLELSNGKTICLEDRKDNDNELLNKYRIRKEESILTYGGDSTASADEYHTLRVPRGGEYILLLEDGTKIWINSESVLKYPAHFAVNERKVYIEEGEAYFKVAKNTQKPFLVETSGMVIRVAGTEFNVMAYKGKKNIETTLESGIITITAGNRSQDVVPGEQVSYSKDKGELSKYKVNTSYYTSWREGVFEFSDMTLRDIAEQLARWYDADFFFTHEEIGEMRFSGAAKKSKPLEFILDIIKETKAIDYTIKNKTVIIGNK